MTEAEWDGDVHIIYPLNALPRRLDGSEVLSGRWWEWAWGTWGGILCDDMMT